MNKTEATPLNLLQIYFDEQRLSYDRMEDAIGVLRATITYREEEQC